MFWTREMRISASLLIFLMLSGFTACVPVRTLFC